MNKPYCILFSLMLLCSASYAQIKVGDDADDAPPPQGMVLHADPRLAVVLKKHATNTVGTIRSGRGYRVQIYSGNERAKATSIKVDFMRRFPGIATYITYLSPQFRVKVGDYRSRAEAATMYQQVSPLYNPSMIVPDYIVINPANNPAKNDQ